MPLCHALVYALSNPCISTPCWNLLEFGLFGLIELSGLFELTGLIWIIRINLGYLDLFELFEFIWINFSYLN